MKRIMLISMLMIMLAAPIYVKAEETPEQTPTLTETNPTQTETNPTTNTTALKSLKVKGISEELVGQKTWNLTWAQPKGQDYMIVVAETSDPSYVVEGAGKVNLNEGDNSVTISVKNASGEEVDKYILNVKFSYMSTSNSDNPETGNFVSMLAIISGAIIAVGGILFIRKNKKLYKI